MNRKEITTKEDLYKVIELLEKTGNYILVGWWMGCRYFSRQTNKKS